MSLGTYNLNSASFHSKSDENMEATRGPHLQLGDAGPPGLPVEPPLTKPNEYVHMKIG